MAAEKIFYKSNKFWYAVGGVAAVFVGHFTGLTIEEIGLIAGTAITLVGGQAAADWGKHAKAVESEAKKYAELSSQIHFFQNMKTDLLDDNQQAKVKALTTQLLDMASAIKK